jgi:solute:Na+ symporter, SSS family
MVTTIDIVVIITYIVVMFGISIFFSIGQGLDGFLVNSRKTKLALLVLTVVSTNIGAGFFMGVATEAYNTGISFGIVISCLTMMICFVLAYFAPKIKALADSGNIYTLPEFLGQGYSSRKVLLVSATIILIGYFFVTALQFVGIAAVSSVITGLDFNRVLLVAGIITILYTAIGGIRSNVYADAFSFIITVLILVIILPLIITSNRFNFAALPQSHLDPFAFGGPAFFVLSIIFSAIGAFFFMELWQRIFAAESIQTARKAFIISAFIQVPFIVSGMALGLAGFLLFPNIDANTVIFRVFAEFLPPGLLGLGLVAILAILMDTVNALVVVGGSTLVNDFYKPFIKDISEKHLLFMARVFTLGFGFVALLTATFLSDIVKLLLMGAFIMMPVGPSILGLLLWKHRNAKAAVTSMIVGFIATILLIPVMPQTAFAPGFLISLIIYVAVSLISKSPKIEGV